MFEKKTGAETVRWNLADLYPSEDLLETDLAQVLSDAEAFATAWRGKVASLAPGDMARALEQLEAIQDRIGKAYTYAFLQWATDTGDERRGALLQHVREAYTRTLQQLIFFGLEWGKTDDGHATALIASEELSGYRHYLEVERLQRDYLLTEPEEKILAEKAVTGRGAWNRFFDELLGAARFRMNGEDKTEQEVLSMLHEPDRPLRKQAALALTEGLVTHRRSLTCVFNTILADKALDDRLRGYETWLSERNLSNEVQAETVEALIEAVSSKYGLVARFYRLKRNLLGYDELFDYDRYAPVGESDRQYSWEEAREIVSTAYHAFHPRMGSIADLFFDRNWIDAPPTPGKRGGAFSHGAVPSAHPYILLNFAGRARDVQTLAHELGHGIHQYLARKQGVLQADTPLTTAETASVFGEMIVFREMLAHEQNTGNRLAMLVGKIDDTVATVFRQVAMNRFEHAIHTERRERGELSTDRFADLWMQTQEKMFEGSVTLGDHYRHWWSYIPHFIHTPGYVYAYAFGELLVLALYARYLEEPKDFPDRYIALLEAGGSDWPHVLAARMGIDLQDPALWNAGLAAIENLITEAENLTQSLS
ncbi:MAG: M3 family oligoendopeptidase [Bacteroidetes bacterium SB0662_bin_6]|nr:M3 family oligoendopeptidase [Bacteroidetes bacterium SB0668_bin_1]MYE04952.1 M3 family oligoendopeptidase [Bacteroidetes bacterium SB0662_bin_6]